MQPKARDGNGLVFFCKKCKGHRNIFSKYCDKCNSIPVEKYIGQMELAGWKLIIENGIRYLR
jgi:hypothetical protein